MDNCPFEIIQQIFSFACTDNGSTARSLSLVCRYFHEVAQLFDLEYVSVSGNSQLCAFDDILQKRYRKNGHYANVRSLFVSNHPWCRSRQANPNECISESPMTIDDETGFHCSLTRVLGTIESHLQSLTIFFQSNREPHRSYPNLISNSLSALVDLTVYGVPVDQIFALTSSTPRLRRLHLIRAKTFPDKFPDFLYMIAPNISHLRLSGIDNTVEHVDGLLDALEIFSSSVEPLASSPADTTPVDISKLGNTFPSSLQQIIIGQTTGFRTRLGNGCCSGCIVTPVMQRLERLGSQLSRGAGNRLVILQYPLYKPSPCYWDSESMYDVEDARETWLKSLDGYEHAWSVKEVTVLPSVWTGRWPGEL